MKSFEAECLERYFLGPGSRGPIGSVYVADDDLLEIFSVADTAEARKALFKVLPHLKILRAWFSGEFRPIHGKPPDYVHVLIFLCWMQTTKTRTRGDRDFRELLEKHFAVTFKGANMSGLNPMWEHLQEFLDREHGIKLVLPKIHPYRQIGRTERLAFPTWRDRAVFRKLRHFLPDDRLLDPLMVANRISTSRHLIRETMQSLEYNFRKFDAARKRGGREYMETPFWQAWYAIVADQAQREDLVVVEGDFGEFEMLRVSPAGDRIAITSPDEAIKFIPKVIGKLVRAGTIHLESLGFGKYKATTVPSNIILMRRSKLTQYRSDQIKSAVGLNSEWVVARMRDLIDGGKHPASTQHEFGWSNGIRVGGAYLGRTPLAPIVNGSLLASIRVEKNGKPIQMVPLPEGLSLPPGNHSGTVIARFHKQSQKVLLVPRANEVGSLRRLAYDHTREISEDEFHYGTAPALDVDVEAWAGERVAPCNELVTIAEALYERTARGLGFSEAIEIVQRGVSQSNDSVPSEWDILRSFVDAGWIEMILLRHFPVRRILQRPLSAECVGPDLVRISGPTPIAIVERLHAAASAAGGSVETWQGFSTWALRRYVVRTPHERARQDFLRRMDIPAKESPRLAVADVADTDGVHGYKVIGRLDEQNGHFAFRCGSAEDNGLFRLEREESRNPFLYRSVVKGMASQNYVSPSVSILSHHLRIKRGALFAHADGILKSQKPRVFLPSSWARWASDRVLCNPAPAFSGDAWRYHYAIGRLSLSALSRLVPIEDEKNETTTRWIQSFLLSASNRGRKIYDSGPRTIRVARGASGKRQ